MDTLAEFLIEKETITGKEFMKIFREAKGLPEPKDPPKDGVEKVETASEETIPEEVTPEETMVEETVPEEIAEETDVHNEQHLKESETPKENVGIFSGRSLDN